jgi:heme-degrading monooxygenase HmoA
MAVIEIARYKLKAGADAELLIQSEKQIQRDIAPTYNGFLGRELTQGANGEFVLIMRWESQAAADGWNTVLFGHPAGQALGGLVDPATMRKETFSSVAP